MIHRLSGGPKQSSAEPPVPRGGHMGEYSLPWPCYGFSLSTQFLISFIHWAFM